MDKDFLSQIHEAEDQVAEFIAAAELEAKKMQDAVSRESLQLLDQARSEAEEVKRNIVSQAESQARAKFPADDGDFNLELDQDKQEQAVALIAERLVDYLANR